MKFTQQSAFDAIKAKLPSDRVVSDRSINETLENLMAFASEETELTDFVTKIYPAIKTMDGNLRSEVAVKAKEIEEKAKAKTPEQIKAEEEAAAAKKKAEEEAAKNMPEWYKKEKEETERLLRELQDKVKGQETVKTVAERQAAILSSESTKMWNQNIIEIAALGFDFSKETAEADFKTHIETIGSKMGVKPAASTGGNEKPATEKFASAKEELQKSGMIKIEEKS